MDTESILRNENHAARLLEITCDTLLLLRNDGTCIDMIVKTENNPYINDQYTLLGKNLFEVLPRETLHDFKPAVESVVDTGEISNANYDLPAPDKMYYFKCIIQKYDDNHILCQYRDITVRSQMKKNLQLANERLVETSRAARMGYWSYNTSTKILRYAGYVGILFDTNEEISIPLDKYLAQVFPEDRIKLRKLLENNQIGHEVFEFRVIKDKIYFLRLKVVNIHHAEEGHQIIEGYIQNIDDIISSWNELRMITLAVNNSNDSIFATKIDGSLIFANQSCRKLHEIPEDIDITRCVTYELLDNFPDQSAWDNFIRELRVNNDMLQYICNHPFPNYNVISSDCVSYIVQNEYGEYIVWNHCRDISEQIRYENELRKAKEKAEESDQLKSAFISNMSHEIRTPLNAIVGFSAVMSDIDNREERKKFQEIIESNNKRLLTLINEVLDLSKIESGKFELVLTPVNISELCNEIVITHQLNAEGVSLKLDLPDEDFCFTTDKNRLTQVLSNLITNAIKFTPHGTITVGYRLRTALVEFFVEDNGIGIAKDKLDTIFDRFVKLNDFAPGTGLGLSICKSIIERLGGDISVASEQGEGSLFSFRLPLVMLAYDEEGTVNIS
jgi:signal transduction histidine kinase